MENSSEVLSDYYILATNTRADERTRVIKHGDSFGVFDHAGMIRQAGMGELGVYHEGTRFLSTFEVALERRRPLLLSSTVRSDNVLVVDLANPDLPDCATPLARDTVHLVSTSFLWDGGWHVRLRLHNYAQRAVQLELSLLYAADFADIFEVRGVTRMRRGKMRQPAVRSGEVALAYDGLDDVARTTRLQFSPAPTSISGSRASFAIDLEARGQASIDLRVGFEIGDARRPAPPFELATERSRAAQASRQPGASVSTSSSRIDEWIERSVSDMQMMVTRTPYGEYPYAGVPWFSTAFGRDGIIAAWEMLWLDPSIARGVLAFLAATQATANDSENDAEPGKIIHEVRRGEMAALGEVPFGHYYGTVDATPLFVMLAGAYWRRTADRDLIDQIWPNIEAALRWLETSGDLDGDGFVEYARRSSRGLQSQGWKDSSDSISHASGDLATGAIALCEVQGYAYAARKAASVLAHVRGDLARADALDRDADALRDKFERQFWCEELGTYAIALDGDKKPCAVRASNAGHCLFTGIARADRAKSVVDTLLHDKSFSGWGIRTLDAREARYNPLSYHNGSVWPHDNAMIALGMSRYGHKQACARLLAGFAEATLHFDLCRMPELFCGFRQRPHEGPTPYPVACAPQAWAAGAVFMLLQACLGLDIDATRSRIVLAKPILPPNVEQVAIRGLAVGPARVDLVLENHAHDVGVHLTRRDGEVAVITTK